MRFALSPNERLVRDPVSDFHDEDQPAAQTWRLVANAAEHHGLPRPSYGHVRRLVHLERARQRVRRERRAVLADATARLAAGGVPNVPRLIEKLVELDEELVFLEHEAPSAAS